MGAEESNDYRGFNSEQLASMLGKVRNMQPFPLTSKFSGGIACTQAGYSISFINLYIIYLFLTNERDIFYRFRSMHVLYIYLGHCMLYIYIYILGTVYVVYIYIEINAYSIYIYILKLHLCHFTFSFYVLFHSGVFTFLLFHQERSQFFRRCLMQ